MIHRRLINSAAGQYMVGRSVLHLTRAGTDHQLIRKMIRAGTGHLLTLKTIRIGTCNKRRGLKSCTKQDPYVNLQQTNDPYATTSNAYGTRLTPTVTGISAQRTSLADRDR